MIETIINYKQEYILGPNGRRMTFRYENGAFVRDENGELIPDRHGRPYRQWRDHIHSPDDIWNEIVDAGRLPGTTSAPKLQPIAARLVMLQSGMRAPMGIKVKGSDLETIERVGIEIEKWLKQVPSVKPATVVADRIVGKPYLEIVSDREALARYGFRSGNSRTLSRLPSAGAKPPRRLRAGNGFPVRVRYSRELRDNIEALDRILVPGMDGRQIPMSQLAEIKYVRGPQMIKSEDTFLIGYVVFDKQDGYAEVDVVEQCKAFLKSKEQSGELQIPAGVSYHFAGNYENQQHATQTLALILPIALFAIFMIIYFQFRSVPTTLIIFSGIAVAWAGGFILLWLYGQPWFLNINLFGIEMRNLFQIHPVNLSVGRMGRIPGPFRHRHG